MAEIPGLFLRHKVDVEPYEGTGAYGDQYLPLVAGVRCFKDDKRRLVRAASGEEVVSETTLYLRLDQATRFVPGSLVTLPDRTSKVISCAHRDDGGLGAWQHIEVACE